MPLINSLLTAIMRADGDALVLHVGERPYVVTAVGNVDLSKTVLTLDVVTGMLAQLLPADSLTALSEIGAVEHQLQPPSSMRDAFTVVAARGGDDVWIEIRRKRAVVRGIGEPDVAATLEVTTGRDVSSTHSEPPLAAAVDSAADARPHHAAEEAPAAASAPVMPLANDDRPVEVARVELTGDAVTATPLAAQEPDTSFAADTGRAPATFEVPEAAPALEPSTAAGGEAVSPLGAAAPIKQREQREDPREQHEQQCEEREQQPEQREQQPEPPARVYAEAAAVAPPYSSYVPETFTPMESDSAAPTMNTAPPSNAMDVIELDYGIDFARPPSENAEAPAPVPEPEPAREPVLESELAARFETPRGQAPERSPEPAADKVGPSEPAVVVPLTRVVRVEAAPRAANREHSVDRLLALASSRSGEQVYLTSQSRPFLRVEGEMRPIETAPTFSAADIDAIVLELMPESARESHRRGEPAEWSAEFDGVGRVRCATFRDHRGPGVVFHLTTTRPISAEHLGLTRDIQSLATEPEGLVVVAGPRGGGKSTLVAALVDLVNRQHSVSVITIERQIRIVHDNHLALVSQREVRGTGADAMAVVRAALRENPDVFVLEDLKSPEIVQLALDAAGSGRLVILTLTAGSTVSALSHIVESFPPASRKAAQAALAERLRGVVSQVVLRKNGGGRIAARELLLSSSSVAGWIADGQFAQLTSALDSGRRAGLVSLNHVLLSLVKGGTVDASEAYRKADNRSGLVALLEHDGVDTSLLARLA